VRGWGLGLALVRAVAEAHGGSIAVESLAGMGTTFLVDLPLDARPFQKTIATPTP
jgi:signal transduction histidine kinase